VSAGRRRVRKSVPMYNICVKNFGAIERVFVNLIADLTEQSTLPTEKLYIQWSTYRARTEKAPLVDRIPGNQTAGK